MEYKSNHQHPQKPMRGTMSPIKKTRIRKIFKCTHPECSKRSFDCAPRLGLHDDFAHKGIFHFVCDHVDAETGKICGKAFEDNGQLKIHKARPHSDVGQHKATHSGEINEENKLKVALNNHTRRAYEMVGIKKTRWSSRSSNYLHVLGCSIKEAVAHLNNNTRGLKISQAGVQIDHIQPLVSFKGAKYNMAILFLGNINNLQLLPGPKNRAKFNHFNDADKEAYKPIRKTITASWSTWLARGECSCGRCK